METLDGYRQLEPMARIAGAAVLLASVVLVGVLERWQYLLRAEEPSHWWASNGRDVVNALALGTLWLGLRAFGFSGPVALAVGATLVLVLSALQTSLERQRHTAALSAALGLALCTPVLAAPEVVHASFQRALLALFP